MDLTRLLNFYGLVKFGYRFEVDLMKKIYRTDEKGIHMCEVDDDYVMKDGDLLAPQRSYI